MKSAECVKKRKYLVGMHHRRMNVMPHSYVFPRMDPLILTQNWLLGCVKRNIPPLATLSSKDVLHLKSGNQQRNKNKMVCVMRVIKKEARDKNVWIEKLADWTPEKVMVMWDVVSPVLVAKYLKNVKRPKETAWSNLFKKMSDASAFDNRRKKRGKRQSDSLG